MKTVLVTIQYVLLVLFAIWVVVAISYLVFTEFTKGSQKVSSDELRNSMEIATEYRRAGDGWLWNAMNDYLKDDVFTASEYARFKKLQQEVENKVYVGAWKRDDFQFMEKGGIGINKPDGLIERK